MTNDGNREEGESRPLTTPPAPPAPPAISEAEAQVMQALWTREPQSAEELAQTLMPAHDWQLSTVKTLLNRLLHKGAISAERDGRRFLYRSCFARHAWQRREGLSLIDRLFGGRLAPLVTQFASERSLSADDLAALRAMLDDYEGRSGAPQASPSPRPAHGDRS